jgi:hypothetical protein
MNKQCMSMAFAAAALLAVAVNCTGCGAITGLRHVDLWGAKFDLAEGTDFHVGANSIDHVDDRRGVKPFQSHMAEDFQRAAKPDVDE